MTTLLTVVADSLLLATEGVEGLPGSHIASKLAVPIAIVMFCGSVYLLLWANYGAKKAAWIYLSALGGFNVMLGVFWSFGAPGTPVATGLQNFPGQSADQYTAKWFPMEPGSERALEFPKTNSIDNFSDLPTYLGIEADNDEELEAALEAPGPAADRGDIEQGAQVMLALYAPTDGGSIVLGGARRAAWTEAAGDPLPGETRASPFFSVEVVGTRVADDEGVRVAAALIQPYASFVDENGTVRRVEVTGEPDVMYAFKDPGAIRFPSFVWTVVSLALFVVSLFFLDRIEQREKKDSEEVAEAEDLAAPVLQ